MIRSAAIASILLLYSAALGQDGNNTPPLRADWLARDSYGMMTHYLIMPQGDTPEAKTADFNRTVGAFDLDYFLKQFEASGADWLIFTIGQNTSYYCSPNAFLDAAVPGHTSKRDLALEIAQAVHARGKRFIAYLPAETAGVEPALREAFGWNPADHAAFHDRYLQFIRDYSLKLGPLCDGWWLDGCYPGEPVHAEKYDYARWMAACRAGNPAAIVAPSDASYCVGRLKPVTPLQDYMGGEVHLLEDAKIRTDFLPSETFFTPEGKVRQKDHEAVTYYMPGSRFIDGVQWHALVPLDSTFNPAVPVEACTYDDATLQKFVRECKAVGGAVTLNVPIDTTNGHVPEASAQKLERLGRYLRTLDANIE